MADSVFESYVQSVYGSGSGLAYFDSVQGGDDIFGGANPIEIMEELEAIPLEKKQEQADPIIGYIQIGLHSTPIVESDASDSKESTITAPMELNLCMSTSKSLLKPEDVGKALEKLISA